MIRFADGFLLMVVVGLLATSAVAQLSTAFSYQGVLDDGGSPANGAYDFQFRLFDAETGGAQVGGVVTSTNQAVTDGLIQQQPDFGSIFTGQRLWIEVSVRSAGSGLYSALPRRELVAAPNAQFAVRAAEATFAETSGTTLEEAINNSPVVDLAGQALSFFDSVNQGNLLFTIGNGLGANVLNISNPLGERGFLIAADPQSGGGFFVIGNGPDSSLGFEVSNSSFNDTFVFIDGSNSMSFQSGSAGDNSVNLPQDAISPAELLAEPGLAANTIASSAVVPVDPTTIVSRTITAPAAGFVVAIATTQFFIDHQNGTDSAVNVTLSTIPDFILGSDRMRHEIESSVGTDSSLSRFFTLHDVFPVSEGSTTIYLNAAASGGGVSTDSSSTRLTLLYVPTAYGTVSRLPRAVGPAGDLEPNLMPGSVPALTPADLAAERDASIADNDARIAAEVAALRAEVAQMREERLRERRQNGVE